LLGKTSDARQASHAVTNFMRAHIIGQLNDFARTFCACNKGEGRFDLILALDH